MPIAPGNAVKAFIVRADGDALVIRRRPSDVHHPGQWDLPGGRLHDGEDPYAGLAREVREETGMLVDIGIPLDVHHFTRDDGQVITMVTFLCHPHATAVQLSEEHTEYAWVVPRDAATRQPHWLPRVVERYERWGNAR